MKKVVVARAQPISSIDVENIPYATVYNEHNDYIAEAPIVFIAPIVATVDDPILSSSEC